MEAPRSFKLTRPVPGQVLTLSAKESELAAPTEQFDMSQGMFRALSLIIQLTYASQALKPGCILIDDIGEGLDFERSNALIRLVIDRCKESLTQLIMTTNDRFVMNSVPLENWILLDRKLGKSIVYSYANSKAILDEFREIGLSNFDFLASDFVNRSKDKGE